jgi:hypothetical protein
MELRLEVMERICKTLHLFLSPDYATITTSHRSNLKRVLQRVQESSAFILKLNFCTPVDMEALDRHLSTLDENHMHDCMVANTGTQLVPFREATKLISQKLDLSSELRKLWEEEKYELIVIYLQNVKQHSKITKDTVVSALSNHFSSNLKWMQQSVADLKVEAKCLCEARTLDQLAKILLCQTKMQKSLGGLVERFPSNRNEVVEELKAWSTLTVQVFYSKHRNVNSI